MKVSPGRDPELFGSLFLIVTVIDQDTGGEHVPRFLPSPPWAGWTTPVPPFPFFWPKQESLFLTHLNTPSCITTCCATSGGLLSALALPVVVQAVLSAGF